jgi:PAS domain S-box-containing protein
MAGRYEAWCLSPEDRRAYTADRIRAGLHQIRLTFVVFIFLYGLFAIFDLLLVEDYLSTFLFIRFGIVIPLMIVLIALTFHPSFHKFAQPLIVLCCVTGGTGIAYMLILYPENFSYYGGIFLVILAGYFLIKLDTPHALFSGLFTLFFYVAGYAWHYGTLNMEALMVVAFFLGANLIGALGSYQMDRIGRANFLHKREIHRQNEQLHDRVREQRTELLQIEKAIDSTSDAVVIFNPQGVVTYCNAAYKLLMRSLSFSDTRVPHLFEDNLANVLTGEPWKGERTVADDMGVKKVLLIQTDAVHEENGNIAGTVTTCRDITERKQAEQINRILFAISDAVNSTEDLLDLYRTIRLILGSIIDVTNFFIAIVDRSKRTLYFPYHADTVDEDFSPLDDFGTESSLTGLVVAEKKSMLLRNNELQERDAQNGIWGPSPLIWMGSPLLIREEVIGVVALQSYTNPYAYDEVDLQLLTAVSQQIATAIERKRFLDKLQESEERLNFLVKNSSDCLIIINADGSLRYVSPAAEKISGYPVIELERRSIDTLIHPDDLQDVMVAWNEVIEHPEIAVTVQFRHIHKIEEWVFFEAIIQSFLNDPAINGIIASVRNITEHKRVERFLKDIIAKNPMSIQILDKDGLTIETNHSYKSLFGDDPPAGYSLFSDPQLLQMGMGELFDQLRNGATVSFPDIYYNAHDSLPEFPDAPAWIRIIGFPLNDSSGKPEKFVLMHENITERKEHEKEHLKNEKLGSLGILAGGLAHDFNNILTAIMGNISFAKVFLESTHKSYPPLAEAEKASVRAGELAHQLLTFARGGEPIKKVVAPQHLVNEAVSLVLRGSNVKAIVDIDDLIHAIEADEGQMSQVFHNLIINATQAMPGGGTLMVTALNETLAENNSLSLPAGTYIRLTFADQGFGISSDNLKRIFDPYFTTKSAGNGLGLASVHSIVNRHGGHISVSSAVEKGTTFTILLPSLGEIYTKYQTGIVTQATDRQRGGSILVMDDEEMIRDIASLMLTHLGYEVTTCEGGEEAVELYKNSIESGTPFLAVIMDLTIPGGIGGKEAAKQILSAFPDACLIVSSGYSNDPIMSSYREYGFSGTIAKPYNIHEVQQVLGSFRF